MGDIPEILTEFFPPRAEKPSDRLRSARLLRQRRQPGLLPLRIPPPSYRIHSPGHPSAAAARADLSAALPPISMVLNPTAKINCQDGFAPEITPPIGFIISWRRLIPAAGDGDSGGFFFDAGCDSRLEGDSPCPQRFSFEMTMTPAAAPGTRLIAKPETIISIGLREWANTGQ